MRILSSLIVVLLLSLGACSKSKQDSLKQEDIPDAPDIIFGTDANPSADLSFEAFLSDALGYYQSKDSKALDSYIKTYEQKFTSPSEKENLDILRAMSLLVQKQYENARTILEPLAKSSSKGVKGKSLFYLGEIQRLNEHYPQAIDLYLQAHQFYPSDEIYSSLADTYAQIGNWEKSILFYKKVLKGNPQASEDLFLLGAAYYQKKDYKHSEQTMQQVLKINPKDGRAYEYLGQIAKDKNDQRNYYYYSSRNLLLKKDYKSVVLFLEDVDLVYKDSDLTSILISSLVHNREGKKALDVYNKAIKQSPKFTTMSDFKIYYGILSVIPKQGKEAGEKYFRNLAKKYPNDFLVVSTYADVVESINKNNPALESIFLQILMIDPTDTASRYKLANLYQSQEKMDLSQLEYGILYYYQDQKDLALEALLGIERRNAGFKNIQLPLYIGLLYQERGEKELAMQFYKKALSLDKNNPVARLSIKKLSDKS